MVTFSPPYRDGLNSALNGMVGPRLDDDDDDEETELAVYRPERSDEGVECVELDDEDGVERNGRSDSEDGRKEL